MVWITRSQHTLCVKITIRTKKTCQHTHVTSHFTAPLHIWLPTPAHSVTRHHITCHCISVLQCTTLTPPMHSQQHSNISSRHTSPKSTPPSHHTSPPLYTYDFRPLHIPLHVTTSHTVVSACCNAPYWHPKYIRNDMQTSHHVIRHSKHPHHIAHSHIPQRMTFDPSWFCYTSAHHIPLHQRVAMRRIDTPNTFVITSKHLIMKYVTQKHTHHIAHSHIPQRMTFGPCIFRNLLCYHIPLHQRVAMRCIDASNTFAITCKHLNTKYTTQNIHIISHTHTPILVKLLTPPGSATRYTTIYHCITMLL